MLLKGQPRQLLGKCKNINKAAADRPKMGIYGGSQS